MNNPHHKVAFTSVCTALTFALVANKEAKAAVFTLTSTNSFITRDSNQDGLGDYISDDVPLPVGKINGEGYKQEYRAFYEFNIATLSLAPNTAISNVVFQAKTNTLSSYKPSSRLDVYGYIGDGQADVSDFEAGQYLNGTYLSTSLINTIPGIKPAPLFSFTVLPFISQSIINNDTVAGFSLRLDDGYLTLNEEARLTIITVDVAEPVPEPTTIFGSALALSLGGWLKRKKSSQQNKTTP